MSTEDPYLKHKNSWRHPGCLKIIDFSHDYHDSAIIDDARYEIRNNQEFVKLCTYEFC
jgi:hypothetical protein